MEQITLKNTDIQVPRLCIGGCPFGQHGWGEVQESDILEAISCSVANGLTFFDTADVYGLGKSEEMLGKALKSKRSKAVIATKFGLRIENGVTVRDNSSEWIEAACIKSLKRLQTDYIDLYQLHYRDEMTPLSEVAETLDRLKQKGYIRAYGLSNIFEKDRNELSQFSGVFSTFQDEYSLACRKNETDILAISQQMSLTPLTWGSLGQGILSGKYNSEDDVVFKDNDRRSREVYANFHGNKLAHNLKIVEVLNKISAQIGKSHSAIALRFILDHIPDSCVIAGVKSSKQVKSNMESLGWTLSDEHMDMLLDVSKIH